MSEKRRWTKDEENLLAEYSKQYLAQELPALLNRSYVSIKKKALKLGIELKFKEDIWEEWQINYLRENINKISLRKIQKNLGLDYYRVLEKCEELGIEYMSDKWSEEDIQFLKDSYFNMPINELSKILNRTESAIATKASKLGIKKEVKRVFSSEELEYIKNNWGIIPVVNMSTHLKTSRVIIQNKADAMNLPRLGNNPYKKWDTKNIEKLKILAESMTISELAKKFHTTNTAIITVAYRNNILLKDSKTVWSAEDIQQLSELAKIMDVEEISQYIGRSTSSIRQTARRNNIELLPNKKCFDNIWTKADEDMLISLANEGKTLVEIAILMNKNDETISKKAKELKINIVKDPYHIWSEEEIKKLRELSKTTKINDLVKIFKQSSSSIKTVAKKNGITIICNRKNWTKEEYQLLEELVLNKKSPKEIAEILGRSEEAIIIKINRKGLKLQTGSKKFWTEAEEELLADLWGTKSLEYISQKLDRSISSITNKASKLGLGSIINNNYNGLTLEEIADNFKINFSIISVAWISLGLKIRVQKVSSVKRYRYVTIEDLLEFLRVNQNIWDSRKLEKNILGKEPEWLIEKRKKDIENDFKLPKLYLERQKLLLEQQKNYNEEDNKTLQKKRN